MGHPGYAFGYDSNHIISEIRYFGTNVERQTNLGSITEINLKKQLGQRFGPFVRFPLFLAIALK